MDALRVFPVLAVVRRATGTIVDVSDWLLRTCKLRREEVVGRDCREVWPQPDSWAEADRRALESGELETLELSHSGRWWRSRRVRLDDDLVLWTGEDATAEVQLAAMRALSATQRRPASVMVAQALLASRDARDICSITGLPIGKVLEELARII